MVLYAIWSRCLGDQQPFFALCHRLTDAADFAGHREPVRHTDFPHSARPVTIVLGGHCYGGILAYDVAHRDGRDVADRMAVALVDVDTPGYPSARGRY